MMTPVTPQADKNKILYRSCLERLGLLESKNSVVVIVPIAIIPPIKRKNMSMFLL